MQISLRSQLVAGVAALGVTAVVVTPVVHPHPLPSLQRVSAAFSLTQFVNPVIAIGQVVQAANTSVFSQAPTPDYFFPGPSDTFPYDLFYQPSFVGVIPDVAGRVSFGALNAAVSNLSGYTFAGISGVAALGGGVAAAVFGAPLALVEAAGALIGGDPQAALQILINQVVAPLQAGVGTALSAIGYIVDNVITNVRNVFGGLAPITIGNLASAAIGIPTYLFSQAVETVSAVVANLSGGDFEGAWNAAVNGFLGPDGTLGSIEKLTVGVGIVEDIEGESTIVVPSVRTVVNDALLTVGEPNTDGLGILNPPFDPTPAPTAAVAEADAAQAVEAAAITDGVEAAEQDVESEIRSAATEAASDDAAPEASGDSGDDEE